MRYIKTILGAGALLCAASLPMYGVNISLFESAGNVNGTVTTPIDQASWDEDTGLGTILVQVTGAGAHNVAVFLDHEIEEANNTFFNEFGSTSGSLAAGQSWEIDEPGNVLGDIYDNFLAGALDNSNAVTVNNPDDVSMALAWAFNLAAGETGYLSFLVSQIAPTSGFYLIHTDPDSNDSIYFSSILRIGNDPGTPGGLPDGGSTLALLLCAFAGLAGWRSVRKS